MTSTPPTEQQLDEIETRHTAATPGPWFLHADWPGRVFAESEFNHHVARVTGSNPESNERFIAHAREDVPLLLDTVRRQRARVAELEVGLNDLAALVSQWHGQATKAEDRVVELEGPAVEARAALAALCYDLEDPGTAALGALHLISRVTAGVDAPRDDATRALARHDAQIMRRCAEFVRDTYDGEWVDDAAATLERDADIAERGCPGYEDAGRGDSVAERQLANCKHCGRPRAACLAASVPPGAPVRGAQPSSVSESAQSPTGTPEGRLGDLPSTEDLASADNPTQLRWGLNDVLRCDDDRVIVMLSGPDLEAYWLELDPERAAVLREDLAGPDGAPSPERDTLIAELLPAWEAMYEPGNVSTYLIGYANSEAGAKGAAEAWMRSQAEVTGRLEWEQWSDATTLPDGYDALFELIERRDDGIDTGPGIAVRRRIQPTV